jgi:hypothetical protein
MAIVKLHFEWWDFELGWLGCRGLRFPSSSRSRPERTQRLRDTETHQDRQTRGYADNVGNSRDGEDAEMQG